MDRVDKLSADFELHVDYRAYYLHPEVPPGGIAIAGLYGGNVEYYRAALANFTRLAGQVGLPVGEITLMANTKVPLMVAEVAKEQGVHDKFHRAAFHAYWAEG